MLADLKDPVSAFGHEQLGAELKLGGRGSVLAVRIARLEEKRNVIAVGLELVGVLGGNLLELGVMIILQINKCIGQGSWTAEHALPFLTEEVFIGLVILIKIEDLVNDRFVGRERFYEKVDRLERIGRADGQV